MRIMYIMLNHLSGSVSVQQDVPVVSVVCPLYALIYGTSRLIAVGYLCS